MVIQYRGPENNPLVIRTVQSGKTYSFDQDHDPRLPSDIWFQQTHEGKTLFVVFYTQACRWAQCLGCNLPSKMSANHVHFSAIMAQIDYLFHDYLDAETRTSFVRIIVSNNGSVLDERTFSTTALIYLVAMITMYCPQVRILSLETRPEYVDMVELEVLSRALQEGDSSCQLELAVGFEAFDDRIRNDHFRKGLPLDVFEKMIATIAPFHYRLKVYLMQKPIPGISDDEAIHDVQQSIRYLSALTEKYGIPINVHLNPTYVARGTQLETAFIAGNFKPPALVTIARAVLVAENTALSVFIGLYDEGLAVEGGSVVKPGDEPTAAQLERFNQSQDYHILRDIVSAGCCI